MATVVAVWLILMAVVVVVKMLLVFDECPWLPNLRLVAMLAWAALNIAAAVFAGLAAWA